MSDRDSNNQGSNDQHSSEKDSGEKDSGCHGVGRHDAGHPELDRRGRPGEWGRSQIRMAGFAVAIGLLIPLITARILQPNLSGLGTHQQLGLPPCSMRVLIGIRCPACGMTTSWSHFTRGHLAASFEANAGGLGLAILALWIIVVSFASVWTGKRPSAAIGRNLSFGVAAIGIITMGDWLVRLWRS